VTVIVITHDANVGARARKILHIVDGEILEHKAARPEPEAEPEAAPGAEPEDGGETP
jgi:ABC-type siderophore export system fused ATPase/permease subunit